MMRILVLGAGGIGGYFGGRLAEAGADVTFLVRPRRAAQIASDGLVVRSPAGDISRKARTIGADDLAGDGRHDLVLLTCKAYDLDAAIASVAPAVKNGAVIVPMLNGMRHLDRLDAAFGRASVLGGLCQIAATLTPEGEVRHLNTLHLMIVGPRAPGQEGVSTAFADAAAPAKFDFRASDVIAQDMWEKWVLLTTLGGMTCLMRANVGEIMQADDGEALMLDLLAETDRVAGAAGHAARPAFLERARGLLTERGSVFAASMLRDVQRGGPTEAAHIVGDMLARARDGGIQAPVLRAAWCHLQAYEAQRRAGAA
ncbi:MAG: 2-dehydropantoate 2-reductase [Acetobacteraceae bacterium]